MIIHFVIRKWKLIEHYILSQQERYKRVVKKFFGSGFMCGVLCFTAYSEEFIHFRSSFR